MNLSTGPTYGQLDASFKAAGGIEGVQKLVEDFYQIMEHDGKSIEDQGEGESYANGIRTMHPTDLTRSIDKLARFLCGWLGGPRRYREKYGPISIPQAHGHLVVGESERDAWLKCMEKAIAKQNYSPEFAAYLLTQLRVPAERIFQLSQLKRNPQSK